jgi:DNA-directed RNA polymerase specialized sigma24 family protein
MKIKPAATRGNSEQDRMESNKTVLELLLLINAGDEAALAEFEAGHFNRLWKSVAQGFAQQLTFEDLKDLRQRVLIKIWMHRHRFEPGTNDEAIAYVRTILRHDAIAILRSVHNHLPFDVEFDILTVSSTPDLRLMALQPCIAALPLAERRIIELTREGWSDKEISTILQREGIHLSPRSIPTYRARAYAKLTVCVLPRSKSAGASQ